MSSSRGAVPATPGATGHRLDVNWSTEQFKVNSGSIQGPCRVGTRGVLRDLSWARRLRAGVEVRAPTMATDHAASVVAGARNHLQANSALQFCFEIMN